ELAGELTPFAVSGPSAWTDARRSEPMFPSNPALDGEEGDAEEEVMSGPEFALHPSSWDETSALAGTVPPDMTATPLSAIRPSSSKTFATVLEEEQRRLRQILFWTGSVVCGLLLVAGALYLLLRG